MGGADALRAIVEQVAIQLMALARLLVDQRMDQRLRSRRMAHAEEAKATPVPDLLKETAVRSKLPDMQWGMR
jgi:hypothetical protein